MFDISNLCTLHRIPGANDVLTPQFFGDKTEIRANMGKYTGSGELIMELPSADNEAYGPSVMAEVTRILGYNPNERVRDV